MNYVICLEEFRINHINLKETTDEKLCCWKISEAFKHPGAIHLILIQKISGIIPSVEKRIIQRIKSKILLNKTITLPIIESPVQTTGKKIEIIILKNACIYTLNKFLRYFFSRRNIITNSGQSSEIFLNCFLEDFMRKHMKTQHNNTYSKNLNVELKTQL